MSTKQTTFLEQYGIPLMALMALAAVMLFGRPALAQNGVDLTEGVNTATSSFKAMIKTVFAIAAVVVVVGGLVLSAFKFTQRDPHALHYLVGAIAAGVICGIVSTVL
jgi:drug/metabolite transporter (DMT)-like permease